MLSTVGSKKGREGEVGRRRDGRRKVGKKQKGREGNRKGER